jgi:subtilisin family serine protease
VADTGLVTGRHAAQTRLLAVLIALVAPAAVSPPAVAAEPPEQSYIVVLRDGADSRAVAATHRSRHAADVNRVFGHALNGYAARIPARELAALRADRRVAYVEVDGPVRVSATQPSATWGLDRIDARSGLDGTFSYVRTGTGVTAYIIDTGLRYTHAEFGGRARFGYDAFGGDGSDCNGHGTHVGGTVGGATYGVAKAVGLVAVRVLDCEGSGSVSGVVAGVDWVTRQRKLNGAPAVANMSLGGGISSSLDTAVKNSIAAGVTYAVAAGNGDLDGVEQDACNYSPARVPEAITIGATDRTDKKTSWSNYGSCVDWFAPGAAITAAWYEGDTQLNTISGTSMATPHVAGAAALYLQSNPTASASVVREALYANTTRAIVTSSRTAGNHLLYAPADPNKPPAASFASGCSGLACSFDGSRSSDAEGPIASYAWSFGDGASATSTAPSHTYRSDGTHTITLTVSDAEGATATASKTITIDTTAPETVIDSAPARTINSASASFAFSSEPGATFECKFDGGDWQTCEPPRTYASLGDGEHTFAARATDAHANTDATPASRTFTVDTTAPDTFIGSGPTGTSSSASATFELSSESGATFECRLDSGDWEACASTRTYNALGDGEHTFAARATDAHANTDATPASRTFTIDTKPTAAPTTLEAPSAAPQQSLPAPAPAGQPAEPAPAPSGQLGLTINDGARFTNDARVTLSVGWPAGATDVLISNHAGFSPFDRLPVATRVTWKLDLSGPERRPKTVYARFKDGAGTPQPTLRDDIVLDRTAPRVRSATAAPSRGARGPGGRSSRSYVVVLAARDATSGVRRLQFAHTKRRPTPLTRYRARTQVRLSYRPRFVRVRDGAGNFSSWKALRLQRPSA